MNDGLKFSTPQKILTLDKNDPLAFCKKEFNIPSNIIYLNGNSLGPLMHRVQKTIADVVENQWGKDLIKSWNIHDWINLPSNVGDIIGEFIGARRGSVIACDSTSINLAKVLSAAINLKSSRQTILTDHNNFPTDLYVAQGILSLYPEQKIKIKSPKAIIKSLNHDVAVLMLTHVDYRTGEVYDMADITAKAREKGIITIWDLSHSTGAVPVNVSECGVDFAIGCSYKYLNAGPGSPAYLYVAPPHLKKVKPVLSGWMGHKKPFAFELGYQPALDANRFQVGTPSIIGLSALKSAMTIWQEIDHKDVWEKSQALSEFFLRTLFTKNIPNLKLISPKDVKQRGSHISLKHHMAYALTQALIDHDIIVDFRAPDICRIGFTPLYNSYKDIYKAAKTLEYILDNKIYTKKQYRVKQKVT